MISINPLGIWKCLKAGILTTAIAIGLCLACFSNPVLADASVGNAEPISNANLVAYYPFADETTQETKQVWAHHIEAWDARDLDAIMAGYGEDSILIRNNIVFKGLEEIRGVFDGLFQLFDNGNNIIDPAAIEEEVIYITWHFTPNNDREYYGTDSFVVQNGIIKYQTIASLLYEKY